jgi:starch synthase
MYSQSKVRKLSPLVEHWCRQNFANLRESQAVDPNSLKILYVASEVAPFAKVGGLGDVSGALPKALKQLGHDIRILMPLYQQVPKHSLTPYHQAMGVPLPGREHWCGLREGRLPKSEVPVYFLDYQDYYNRPGIYSDHGDGLARYALLSRASLQLCRYLHWQPDVIHCNDWQTSLIPAYLNTLEAQTPLANTATLLTVHNLAYQGEFGGGALSQTGLPSWVYQNGDFQQNRNLNLLKGGLFHSTLISTVSPTYAHEIQTSNYGAGLDWVLRERSAALYGVLNGIDVDVWNPARDPYLPARYNADNMEGKALCKRALQAEFGLPQRDVPLIGFVGRLVGQKGIDVIAEALPRILNDDVQFVLLGSGEPWAERAFSQMAAHHRFRCGAKIAYSEAVAHRIEAGSDFFLMPSHFEPCGLNQMYSMRYGTLPIVRATGGLHDSVINHHEHHEVGTGFKLWQLSPESLYQTVHWACQIYRQQADIFHRMRQRAMNIDFSWHKAASKYEALYQRAVAIRKGFA